MEYTGSSNLISPDQLYQTQRAAIMDKGEEIGTDSAMGSTDSSQEVSASQSANYNNAVAQATGHIVELLARNTATNNVPAYNKFEENGRAGLVDPSEVGEATMLPEERRMEQAMNMEAIVNSLPPQMQMQNMELLELANKRPIELMKELERNNSLYKETGFGNFAENRINLALEDKRMNSLYGMM